MRYGIRTVGADDAPSIVDILDPIMRAGTHSALVGPVTVEDQIAFIRELPPRGIYHLAVETASGRVVGIQDLQPIHGGAPAFAHVGEISTFVALDAHRLGVGRQLMGETVRVARGLGYRKIMAMIRGDNDPALAFYRSQGFGVIGIARAHVRIGGEFIDEVLAERFIEP